MAAVETGDYYGDFFFVFLGGAGGGGYNIYIFMSTCAIQKVAVT